MTFGDFGGLIRATSFMNKINYEENEKKMLRLQEKKNKLNSSQALVNPEFDKRLKAVSEAMRILTAANVETIMFCDPKHDGGETFMQYNNGRETLDPQWSPLEKARHVHSSWRKLAIAVSHHFGLLRPDVHFKKAGPSFISNMVNTSLEDWRLIGEKQLPQQFDFKD